MLMRKQDIVGPARVANMLVDVYDLPGARLGITGGTTLHSEAQRHQARSGQKFATRELCGLFS